jgi:hypothetical protein
MRTTAAEQGVALVKAAFSLAGGVVVIAAARGRRRSWYRARALERQLRSWSASEGEE